MPYADPEKKRANSRRRYRENPDYYKKKAKRWTAKNYRRKQYLDQKSRAKFRDVPWKITFDEWIKWWGNDIDLRGRRRNQLQMCRYADAGAYEIGNIYKATQEENDAGPRPFPEITF